MASRFKILTSALAIPAAVGAALWLTGCGASPSDTGDSADTGPEPVATAEAPAQPTGASETATLSAMRLRVTGMMASKGGAIWMAWPDGVRDALDALPSVEQIAWDDKFEVVSFMYDPAQVDRPKVEAAIKTLGYGTEEAGAAPAKAAPTAPAVVIPEAVRPLFEQAAKEGKLVALKFTATWCAPCKGMTKETIHNPDVAAELAAKFVFREIDTDELPAVSKAFGVNGIPDTRFFRPDGTQIDQIRGFEGSEPFLKRLRAVQLR